MEEADSGDLAPLIALFVEVQTTALTAALGIADPARPPSTVDEALDAAVARSREASGQQAEQANALARRIMERTLDRCREVRDKLESRLGGVSGARFVVDDSWTEIDRRRHFRPQVAAVADQLGYFANPGPYHDWVRLALRAE